nr:CRISPR-associated endonuclease Cas6 [Cecembia calidifontis]
MSQLLITTIRFPEIKLQTRDAHKLRGFFGDYFQTHSPLLHNHYEDGTAKYKYPLVQYKVVETVPILLGINEGAELLTSLFLKIDHLNIEGKVFPVFSKNIAHQKVPSGIADELFEYRFINYWMALNTLNYKTYTNLAHEERQQMLDKVLQNNLLSFYKGVGIWLNERIMTKGKFEPKTSKFKNQKMIVFEGSFISNAILPDYVGIGKSVSRGFGVIKKMKG